LKPCFFPDQEANIESQHQRNKKEGKNGVLKGRKKYRSGKGRQLKVADAIRALLDKSKTRTKPKGKDLRVNLKKRLFTTKKEIKDYKTLVSHAFLSVFYCIDGFDILYFSPFGCCSCFACALLRTRHFLVCFFFTSLAFTER
jgi:hypothetical protein